MKIAYDLKDLQSIRRILLNGASSSFAVKICAAALAFSLQIVLARTMGEIEYGIYTYITSLIMMMALLSPLGINKTTIKFIPAYIADKNYLTLRKYTHWTFLSTFSTSLLMTLIFIILITTQNISTEITATATLIVGCLLIPINSLIQLGMEIVRAFRRVFLSEFANTILRPLLIIFTVIIWNLKSNSPPETINILTINIVVGLVVIYLLFKSAKLLITSLPSHQSDPPVTEPKLWLATAIPLLLVASGNIVLGRTDIIMIGSIINTTQAGFYNAAERISYLSGFPLLAINTIVAPLIAQLFAEKRNNELMSIIFNAAWICFISSLFLSVIIIIYNEQLLSFFGASFRSQSNTLLLLLVGQIFCSMLGPAGYLLAMTGKQNYLALIVIFSAAVNIISNMYLIPLYGNFGAAAGTVSSLILSNILMVIIAIKTLGINSTIFSIRNFRDLSIAK